MSEDDKGKQNKKRMTCRYGGKILPSVDAETCTEYPAEDILLAFGAFFSNVFVLWTDISLKRKACYIL